MTDGYGIMMRIIPRQILLIGIAFIISASLWPSPATALEREWVHEICKKSDQPELCGIPEDPLPEDDQQSLEAEMHELRQRVEAMFYHAVR